MNQALIPKSREPREQHRRLVVGAMAASIVIAAMLIGNLILEAMGCQIADDNILFLAGFSLAVVGLLITIFRPRNRIGWLLLIGAFGMASSGLAERSIVCQLAGRLQLPGLSVLAWFDYHVGGLLIIVPLFILMPFLFPTGQFLGRRWRVLCWGGLSIVIFITLATVTVPNLSMDNGFGGSYGLESPLALEIMPLGQYPTFFRARTNFIILLSILAIISMILRLRRSIGVERQQMKWFTYFLATAVTIQLLLFELPINLIGEQVISDQYRWFDGLYSLVLYIVFVGWPLVIGLAIFRYRLYDIDIIIRRTLQYAIVSGVLALCYFGSVILLQTVTGLANETQSPLTIVVSTLFIAALFNPVRHRVQRLIDRRFYRRQFDAQQVLAQFAQTTRDEVDAERLSQSLLEVVQQTMQPEGKGIWIKR